MRCCFVRLCRTRADREYIRQDITYILQRIQEDLLKGFLVVPFRDDAGIWSAGFINDPTNVTVTTDKCPKGSYSIGSDKGCSEYIKFKLCKLMYD